MELLLSQFQLHGTKTGLKVHINNQNSSYYNSSVADFTHTFSSTFSLMCDKCWSSLSSASNCLEVIRNNPFHNQERQSYSHTWSRTTNKECNPFRGLLTSVYHGDLGVAGLLLLKHRILWGTKNAVPRNTLTSIFFLSKCMYMCKNLKTSPCRFFRIRFAFCISFLHSAIFSWADVIFCSAVWNMHG